MAKAKAKRKTEIAKLEVTAALSAKDLAIAIGNAAWHLSHPSAFLISLLDELVQYTDQEDVAKWVAEIAKIHGNVVISKDEYAELKKNAKK